MGLINFLFFNGWVLYDKVGSETNGLIWLLATVGVDEECGMVDRGCFVREWVKMFVKNKKASHKYEKNNENKTGD